MNPIVLNTFALWSALAPLQANDSVADEQRIGADIARLAGFGTRHTLSDTESDTRGIGAARRWLLAEMEAISAEFHDGRLQARLVEHDIQPSRRMPNGVRLANVMGVLEGRESRRMVIVSGHYDSIPSNGMDATSDAPGANDDASGTAVVLECARLLAGIEPRATIVFLAVAGEEQGLLGAAAQARELRDAGVEVEAFLTNDIVGGARGSNGRLEPMRVRVFSEGVPSGGDLRIVGSDNDAPSRQLARYVREIGGQALPDFEVELIFRQDRYLRGGDHRAFNDLGYAGIRFTEPNENYDFQHQDVREEDGRFFGDRVEHVDFDYVARVATVNAAALRALALAPAPPKGVGMDVSRLTPHTRLFWEAGTEVAGYRVRMRRTYEPFWTDAVDAGDATEITLEGYSKDNWLFAVEAYDDVGNTSLAVYPQPRRR